MFLFCFSSFLCTLCCQFLWIVFVLFSSSCVPYVASFSGLFLFCFLRSCVPYVASFSGLFLFCFLRSCVPYVASFSGLFLFCFLRSCVPYVASFSGLFLFCFLRSCVTYVASFSGLFLFCFSSFLCTLCCQFLWIVFVLFFFVLVYPMLPVSLDCFCFVFLRSCVPYVASFSGLFLFCFSSFLCTLCCQFLWIVFVLFFFVLVYPMLPVSLDCFCFVFLRSCVPYVASFSGLLIFDCPFGILERLFKCDVKAIWLLFHTNIDKNIV